MDINLIRSKIKDEEYELTLHAIRRRIERKISTRDIETVILNGEIIEEYPDDKPFPSCLIAGLAKDDKPIYVVCAIAPVVKIITVYVHKEDKWAEYKRRKER
ncbi:MAG: DUF4258 domain-containing protein [Candidatus Hydrothermarchaeaceae archaeon]